MLSKTTLSGTDLIVSQLCYGTNMLGTAIDQPRANAILDRFATLGGNFIDTARSYGDWVPDAPPGASERAIGAWLKGRTRAALVIATKGGFFDMRVGDWRNRITPDDIAQDLSESLEHLGVETIDLYWLHADNPQAPVQPIIDALLAHQKAGRIRYFGASNWSADRILEANAYATSIGQKGFAAIQPFWGLAVPEPAAAGAQGYQSYYEAGYESLKPESLPVVPYAAQSGGFFTKMEHGGAAALPEGLAARYNDPANARRFAVAQALAAEHGVPVNAVVLAYLTSQPKQTIPIFGASTPEQIEATVAAASLHLSAAELQSLRAA